jgi:hypothetical protein
VYGNIRANRLFAHLSDDQIVDVFDDLNNTRGADYWAYCDHVKSTWDDMPRFNEDACLQHLAWEHGLHCSRCEKAGKLEDLINFTEGVPRSDNLRHWRDHGVCSDCAVSERVAGWKAIQQTRDAAAFARRIDENYERKKQADADARAAAKKRRLIEKAAYDFLAETGLLASLEATI